MLLFLLGILFCFLALPFALRLFIAARMVWWWDWARWEQAGMYSEK